MTLLIRSGINKICITTLFWLVFFYTGAQVPGYQGKKLFLEYDNYFCPAFYSPNVNGHTGIMSFNDRHGMSLDYIISKHYSLGISIQYLKTKYKYPDWYAENINISTTALGNLTAYAYGLHYRQFYTFLAPVGSYYRVEIQYLTYRTSYDSAEVWKYQKNRNYRQIPELDDTKDYHGVAVCLSYGYQRIFYNRIILDSGFQIAINTLQIGMYETDLDEFGFNRDNYLELSGKSRLAHHYFFNIYAGIGILLF
jgi:hypothetical protein